MPILFEIINGIQCGYTSDMSRLGTAGRKLAEEIGQWLKDNNIELDPHERALVFQLCETADRLAYCRRKINRGDFYEFTDEGKKLKDWMQEERSQRLVFMRLVGAVGLPTGITDTNKISSDADTTNVVGLTPESRARRKAALKRWAGHQPKDKQRTHRRGASQ